MPFKNVIGKMGNMRKPADWVLCPQSSDRPNEVIIQSDKRIAKIDLSTGKAILSSGKGGHPGFIALHPSMGSVEVDVPADLLAAVKGHVVTNTVGNGIDTTLVVG